MKLSDYSNVQLFQRYRVGFFSGAAARSGPVYGPDRWYPKVSFVPRGGAGGIETLGFQRSGRFRLLRALGALALLGVWGGGSQRWPWTEYEGSPHIAITRPYMAKTNTPTRIYVEFWV